MADVDLSRGFVRLWRKAEDSQVFNDRDPAVWKVWSWCMMRADYKVGGQFTTGRFFGSERLKLSPSKFYRCLKKLEKWKNISLKSNTNYTTITLCNFFVYNPQEEESEHPDEQRSDSDRTASEHIIKKLRSKEVKNINTNTRRFTKPTVEEIRQYCQERNNQVNPEQFFDYYESKGWVVGKSPMKDWRSAVRTWEKNHVPQNGQTTHQQKIDNLWESLKRKESNAQP